MPGIRLASTRGGEVDLAALPACAVIFAYPVFPPDRSVEPVLGLLRDR